MTEVLRDLRHLRPRRATEPDWYDPGALLRTGWEGSATLDTGGGEADPEESAEHLAFCPDSIFQGVGTIADYAPGLVNAEQWSFWWD